MSGSQAPPPLDNYVSPSGADSQDETVLALAMEKKANAAGLAESGKFQEAIALMTEALIQKPSSAMWWAFRADLYLKNKQWDHAAADASHALERNPDSARALRVRGMAHKQNSNWELAFKDLSASQNLDFNDGVLSAIQEVEGKAKESRDEKRKQERLKEEEAAAKARAEQQEEQRRKTSSGTELKKATKGEKSAAAKQRFDTLCDAAEAELAAVWTPPNDFVSKWKQLRNQPDECTYYEDTEREATKSEISRFQDQWKPKIFELMRTNPDLTEHTNERYTILLGLKFRAMFDYYRAPLQTDSAKRLFFRAIQMSSYLFYRDRVENDLEHFSNKELPGYAADLCAAMNSTTKGKKMGAAMTPHDMAKLIHAMYTATGATSREMRSWNVSQSGVNGNIID